MGERRLSSVTEGRDARYHLDDEWTTSFEYCLEQGLWNFAMRAARLTPAVLDPEFGYQHAFSKPDDWVRTYVVSSSETLEPLLRYNDETSYWFADANPLFVKYVSNHETYGGDLGNWPETFAYYVAARLAFLTCPSICSDSDSKLERLAVIEKRARIDARSKDAMNEPPAFPPRGNWASARLGRVARPRSETLGY